MKVTEIIYCAARCTNSGRPATTTPPSRLCPRCEDNLHTNLNTIADTWPKLDAFIEHGTTTRNPDTKATKAAVAPAPMRLEIIDLLDTRLGRKWNGTAAAHDRRGVAGTVQPHVERLIEERRLTQPHDHRDIPAACRLLDKHRLWLAEQDWVGYLYADVTAINKQVSDAVGDYKQRPVGTCHVVPDEGEQPCGGPLFANTYGGVRCARCRATWDAAHLRQLGLAQAEAEQEAS